MRESIGDFTVLIGERRAFSIGGAADELLDFRDHASALRRFVGDGVGLNLIAIRSRLFQAVNESQKGYPAASAMNRKKGMLSECRGART